MGKDTRTVAWIVLLIVLISAGHYLLLASLGMSHNIFQRLYYAPIIWAAYRFGARGAFFTVALIVVLYLPHILMTWAIMPLYEFNQILELGLFFVVGMLTGYLFEQKSIDLQTLQSYEKMALFGTLSRTVIRSLKTPIQTMKGMLVSLEVVGRDNAEVGLCVDVMQKQVEQIDSMRNDLIALVKRGKLRLKKQKLVDIMSEFTAKISPLLELKNVELITQFAASDIKVSCHKKSILEALDYMTSMLLNDYEAVDKLTLYMGESGGFVWAGATLNDIQLNSYFQSALSVLETDTRSNHIMISAVNTMNNNFGGVRFRKKHQRIVEFIFIFPKKLKLPWRLMDRSRADVLSGDTVKTTEENTSETPEHSSAMD